jgi:hypothetical protein
MGQPEEWTKAQPARRISGPTPLLRGPGETQSVPPGRAARTEAASSVAPVASGYERSLRPCLGTTIAPLRRAAFRQALLDRWGALALEQLARPDSRSHLLRLLAVHGSVLELDHRVLALAAQLLQLVALAAAKRSLDQLVLDALIVQSLLYAPAGMALQLDPDVRAAVKLDGHVPTITRCVCAA